MRLHATVLASALAAALGSGACGDPLTDGGWPGTPDLVVRGTSVPLEPGVDAELALALVWAPVGPDVAPPPRFPVARGEVDADADFGSFELALYAAPPGVDALDPSPRVGLLTVLAVPPTGLGRDLAPGDLAAMARAVSADHYLVWVADAEAGRAAMGATLMNPIALVDGYNLAVGVCRPGRPSQLLVVPPERLAIVAVADAEPGGCLDVFWGPWRAR